MYLIMLLNRKLKQFRILAAKRVKLAKSYGAYYRT